MYVCVYGWGPDRKQLWEAGSDRHLACGLVQRLAHIRPSRCCRLRRARPHAAGARPLPLQRLQAACRRAHPRERSSARARAGTQSRRRATPPDSRPARSWLKGVGMAPRLRASPQVAWRCCAATCAVALHAALLLQLAGRLEQVPLGTVWDGPSLISAVSEWGSELLRSYRQADGGGLQEAGVKRQKPASQSTARLTPPTSVALSRRSCRRDPQRGLVGVALCRPHRLSSDSLPEMALFGAARSTDGGDHQRTLHN